MIRHPNEVPLGPPGYCLLCMSTPDLNHISVVNTLRQIPSASPGGMGCIYVCEVCVDSLMRALGWIPHFEAVKLSNEKVSVERELEEARNRISLLEKNAIDDLRNLYKELTRCFGEEKESFTRGSSSSYERKSSTSARRRESAKSQSPQ